MTRIHRGAAAAGILFVAALALVTIAPPRAAAAPADPPGADSTSALIQNFKDGYIDWGSGEVGGWGRVPDASRSPDSQKIISMRLNAETKAKAALLAVVRRVRANAESRIGDRPDFVERVRGIVERAHMAEERSGRNWQYQVLYVAPLWGEGGLSYAIYEATVPGAKQDSAPRGPAERAGAEEVPREGPTGVVVDARVTGLQPALLPRIVDESGTVLWSPETVDQDAVKERGMAAYVTQTGGVSDLRDRIGDRPLWVHASFVIAEGAGAPVPAPAPQKQAAPGSSGRQGPRPCRLKASSASGTLKADIVLSKADAAAIEGTPGAVRLLKECRVVVIVESPVGGVEGVRRRSVPPPTPPLAETAVPPCRSACGQGRS